MPLPTFRRFAANPLLTPEDVPPSDPRLTVVGVFNAGGIPYQGGVLLLCRVAEAVSSTGDTVEVPVCAPVPGGGEVLEFLRFRRSDPSLDFSDSRVIVQRSDRKVVALTSLSRLRIARSSDGVAFTFDLGPGIALDPETDSWGAEDPRITPLDDGYVITYTSVSPRGAAVSLLRTRDFLSFERLGVVLAPSNKDVVVFPERIGGRYWMVHRPMPTEIGVPEAWIASSPDLIHWGDHQALFGIGTGRAWESQKLGAASPPLRLTLGWLLFYHGVSEAHVYAVGAVLLDLDDPRRVLARTAQPLLVPERDYELEGFFGNAVFPCAAWLAESADGPVVKMYYGSSDSRLCGATLPLKDVLRALGVQP